MKVSIGVSNRHIHLTKEDLNILFGHELTIKKPLNQIGQFASVEVVTIKTNKDEIPNVRVLGPVRKYTQIEISKTDAYKLGINPPIRESGNVENSEVVTIVGPNGEITKEGCIIATRHIHIPSSMINDLGINPNKLYKVRLGDIKSGIIENVSIRVSDDAYYEMHIDTDDANAHLVKQNDMAEII